MIEHLVLNNNEGLVGSIPTTLGALTELKQLERPSTEILLSKTGFKYMNLQQNMLTGIVTHGIEMLTELEAMIFFFSNMLTGSVTFDKLSFTKVDYLDLDFNSISGNISNYIGDRQSLKYLYLPVRRNNLTGSLPDELGNAALQ
jgi:hypothetical protein